MSDSSKLYQLEFDERQYYFYSRVKCPAPTLEICREYLREIVAECRELEYKRLLIETDMPHTFPVAKLKALASQLNTAKTHGIRIAIVSNCSPNVIRPGRNVMYAAAFTSIPDARQWLVQD